MKCCVKCAVETPIKYHNCCEYCSAYLKEVADECNLKLLKKAKEDVDYLINHPYEDDC